MCTFLINHLQLGASHKRTKDFLILSKVVSKITSLDCGIWTWDLLLQQSLIRSALTTETAYRNRFEQFILYISLAEPSIPNVLYRVYLEGFCCSQWLRDWISPQMLGDSNTLSNLNVLTCVAFKSRFNECITVLIRFFFEDCCSLTKIHPLQSIIISQHEHVLALTLYSTGLPFKFYNVYPWVVEQSPSH